MIQQIFGARKDRGDLARGRRLAAERWPRVRAGPPRFSPVFYLADLITGYSAAAGMMAALNRRAIDVVPTTSSCR
jgi:hypothetical protein